MQQYSSRFTSELKITWRNLGKSVVDIWRLNKWLKGFMSVWCNEKHLGTRRYDGNSAGKTSVFVPSKPQNWKEQNMFHFFYINPNELPGCNKKNLCKSILLKRSLFTIERLFLTRVLYHFVWYSILLSLWFSKKRVGTHQNSRKMNQGATIKEAMVDTPPIPPQARA